MFQIPDDKGRIRQPNNGDSQGNVHMTYGIDFETNKGRIEISEQVKKLVNNLDNANFNGYAASIAAFTLPGGSTGKIFAVSDKTFSADIGDPLATWTQESSGSVPDSGNTIMDSAYFNGLFLVSEATNIKAWNGTTWSSWWQGTLGQAALSAGQRHIIWVGSDGNLYIVDGGNKVYKVTPTGTVSKTGGGTLDFSASNYRISCGVTSSNRSFIGTVDLTGEEAVIIEWDMSAQASSANKLHPIGAKGVRCIAIWNDRPVAILSNGKVKYFDGFSFIEFETPIQFPLTDNTQLATNFIHPNGWAIIDNLPHFLVTGRTDTQELITATKQASYQMPSGVWCLDPSIGLYHRFTLGTGITPQKDYGKMNIVEVGALYSLQKSESKFLASYEYRSEDETTNRSVLVYHDAQNTQDGRGFLMTPFAFSLKNPWKKLDVFHKALTNDNKVRVFYRTDKKESLAQSGVWVSPSQFNVNGVSLGITKGDTAFVKMGNGSGQLLKIANVTESASITVVIFDDVNNFVTTNDKGVLDFFNFRFMGEVTSTTQDLSSFTLPEQARRRKTQLLFEVQQKASSKSEIDFVSIDNK